MQLAFRRPVTALRELVFVLAVAVGVAFMYTAAASVVSQFHQVAAEDLNVHQVPAVKGSNNTQILTFPQWGVMLTMPYGQGMGLMNYATQGPDSVGLSSADLASYKSACGANTNALGAVVRVPAGSLASYPEQTRRGFDLGTFGNYEYVFQMPQNPCMGVVPAANIAAQEGMVVEGDGVLGPVSQ